MRKYKNIILLPLLILSACNNNTELEATIEQQNERIVDYQNEILIQQEEIELLMQEIKEIENSHPFSLEFKEGLLSDLEENLEELTTPFLGATRTPVLVNNNISIHFTHIWADSGQVIVDVIGMATVRFIFSYQLELEQHLLLHPNEWTDDDWENVINVNWNVLGHIYLGNMQLAKERNPRHLTDLEEVTIRLYEQYAWGTYPVAQNYEEHIIQGSKLWEETLNLMPEVSDLWYKGNTLYVDLFPTIGVGSGYDIARARRLQYTFSSFPHVAEIRFTTFGIRAFPGQTWAWLPIFNAVERRNVDLCELAVDDPWIDSEGLQIHWRDVCE